MKLLIKRVDKEIDLPKYETEGAVAFDLRARIDVEVPRMKPTIIPLNVVIKVPDGYFLLLAARSSLPLKKNLMVANGVGIIDEDYCGEDDEIGLQVLNFSSENVSVKKGERIAQAIIMKVERAAEFQEVQTMSAATRGGFGSTGGHHE